jgi:hypothetical protein
VFPYLFEISGIEIKPQMIPTKIKNTQNVTRAVLMPETKDRRAFGTIVPEGVKSFINGLSYGFTFTQCLVRRTIYSGRLNSNKFICIRTRFNHTECFFGKSLLPGRGGGCSSISSFVLNFFSTSVDSSPTPICTCGHLVFCARFRE